MREQFEKLPEIAITIKQGIYYNERDNCYSSISGASYLVIVRINGAWYAYQEQQKKIDAIKKLSEDWHKSSGSALALKVLELLK